MVRGQRVLADRCLEWEAAARRAAGFGTRVVFLRTGLVMERDGGALPKMLLPFRLFPRGADSVGSPIDLLDSPARPDRLDSVGAQGLHAVRFSQCRGAVVGDDERIQRDPW
jgi:hypothetical protein